MTAATSQQDRRSRRALLAGALGGLGTWAAAAAARVDPASAAVGDPIRMGRTNRAGGTQTILETNSTGAALLVRQASRATAVRAEATTGRAIMGVAGNGGTGVWGSSTNHTGVRGNSTSGEGVYAFSGQGVGVFAWSQTGYAAKFIGPVELHPLLDVRRVGFTPGAPAGDIARLFVVANGSGKLQLSVRFPTGAVQVLATEP
jgi:hypothetical protein